MAEQTTAESVDEGPRGNSTVRESVWKGGAKAWADPPRADFTPNPLPAFPDMGIDMITPIRSRLLALVVLVGAATALPAPTPLAAQANPPQPGLRSGALSVFLDCNTRSCNSTFFRTEITFVNWARDRTLSQVHLIVTSVETGGGGSVFTLDFVGEGELTGTDDRLTYTSSTTDTQAEILDGLTQVMAVGLARYAALVGRAADVVVSSAQGDDDPTDRLVSASEVDDPWNFWVFEIGGSFDLEGEETEKDQSYEGRAEARRTTEAWKIELEADGSFSRSEIERSDGTIRVDERTQWNADLLVVHSLAEKWSAGAVAGVGASTRQNQDLGAEFFAAVEYSFLPYPEAPRRSLTARYDIGLRYFDWEEETVFLQTVETRPQHSVRFGFFQRQPWGESDISIQASQYLHDVSLWSASVEGELEFRILRGLSLDIGADVGWTEDQLFISREGLTDEDIFLGRFDRPTDFTYEFSIGLSFEFGSIFNNVVNNRF